MRNIVKAQSFTESERLLAKLAEKAFLSLWAFPNVYKDEGLTKGQGEELCDLLVVFGDHVIIFSDKGEVTYKSTEDINVGWCRWVKRAYLKSSYQVYQAEKWIREFPNRIFLDKKCTSAFPVAFPTPDRIKIHRVVVVRGITKAASEYYNDDSGTLMLRPDIVGDDHFQKPFFIGRPSSGKGYVHLFDEVSIEAIFSELDTISDFTSYLSEKEKFIDGGNLLVASGEDDLLAYYLSSYEDSDNNGVPYFIKPADARMVTVAPNYYKSVKKSDVYLQMKSMKMSSYFWDHCIETMGSCAFTGQWWETNGNTYDEEITVLRYMASEHRIARAALSVGVAEIMNRPFPDTEKLPRVRVLTSPTTANKAYVWMILPRTPELSDYDTYRKVRKNWLAHYCYACKDAFPQYNIIVGIACDAINHEGASEELIYVHTDEWSEAEYAEARRIRKKMGLFRKTIQSHLSYEQRGDGTEVTPIRKIKSSTQKRKSDKKRKKKK